MNTMDIVSFPRGKGGKFAKKKEESNDLSMANPLLGLASVALANVPVSSPHSGLTPSELPRFVLAPEKKRRRSEAHLLKDEHACSERYAHQTLKYDGEHCSLARQHFSQGEPYKRWKRATTAHKAKTRTFVVDDDGDMFDNTPGNRMVGEGLQCSRRCAIAYFFERIFGNPALQRANGKDEGASFKR